jgi:ubiquinone/menaquinone biosynthesis C-methylase UbiE
MTSVQELYGELWAEKSPLERELERSLDPRDMTSLYDAFAALAPGPGDLVVDIGCRDARHAVELHRRFGSRVVAVDPVPLHVRRASERLAEAGLEDSIDVAEAAIEALPLADGVADFVWCRDVLNHVDLPRGLAECARVLRAGGRMLVYQTFATDALEPKEARRLFAATAIVAENMQPAYFEATARARGFSVESVDAVDSEWRERRIEDGNWNASEDLLTIARIRRREAELVERFGRARVEAALGNALWGVYQVLGKLRPTVYVLTRADA